MFWLAYVFDVVLSKHCTAGVMIVVVVVIVVVVAAVCVVCGVCVGVVIVASNPPPHTQHASPAWRSLLVKVAKVSEVAPHPVASMAPSEQYALLAYAVHRSPLLSVHAAPLGSVWSVQLHIPHNSGHNVGAKCMYNGEKQSSVDSTNAQSGTSLHPCRVVVVVVVLVAVVVVVVVIVVVMVVTVLEVIVVVMVVVFVAVAAVVIVAHVPQSSGQFAWTGLTTLWKKGTDTADEETLQYCRARVVH
jgi:hypothetical protein